jgi:hypothetical protein
MKKEYYFSKGERGKFYKPDHYCPVVKFKKSKKPLIIKNQMPV